MVLHLVRIIRDKKGGKVIDHHPVRWIAQFPRDVGVTGPIRKIAIDDLTDHGVARPLVLAVIPQAVHR